EPGAQTQSTPKDSGLQNSESLDAGSGYAPEGALYFAGFEPTAVLSIRALNGYLYWKRTDGAILRAPTDGSASPIELVNCSDCTVREFETDGTHVYYLRAAAGELLQLEISTGSIQTIDLPWAAPDYGIAVGRNYIYVAMPGCAAITRVSKATLNVETMTIDGVAPPGQGYTELIERGEGLLCGGPNELFWIDSWGNTARSLAPIHVLHDVAIHDDVAYWKDFDDKSPPNARIGFVPLSGGESTIVEQPHSAGLGNMVVISSLSKLFFHGGYSVFSFDLTEGQQRFDAWYSFPRPEAGRAISAGSMAADDSYLYAAVSGTQLDPDTRQPKGAYWILRLFPERVLSAGWN
ncbi:MAG TPA: hypothetical protein VHO25_14620, partial [Polyangiaceae bacterium]|nr:hypothetical protein [Polyangiaceae bacterium]